MYKNLKAFSACEKPIIDKTIYNLIKKLQGPSTLVDGMLYSANGGKRLRPLLLLATLRSLGIESPSSYNIASGLELVHCYSLVHDDLPSLDNDDFRRGIPTTHKKYGEANAILIGDALLTYAFEVISREGTTIGFEKAGKIISLLSNYSGSEGMIGGQFVDLESEGKSVTLETMEYIHQHKTGKLLELPIKVACILGDLPKEAEDKLLLFGKKLGLGFQIKDDILDIEGDFNSIGKSVGSDIRAKKSTYPSIYGMDKSKKLLDEIVKDCYLILDEVFKGDNSLLLKEITSYITSREK